MRGKTCFFSDLIRMTIKLVEIPFERSHHWCGILDQKIGIRSECILTVAFPFLLFNVHRLWVCVWLMIRADFSPHSGLPLHSSPSHVCALCLWSGSWRWMLTWSEGALCEGEERQSTSKPGLLGPSAQQLIPGCLPLPSWKELRRHFERLQRSAAYWSELCPAPPQSPSYALPLYSKLTQFPSAAPASIFTGSGRARIQAVKLENVHYSGTVKRQDNFTSLILVSCSWFLSKMSSTELFRSGNRVTKEEVGHGKKNNFWNDSNVLNKAQVDKKLQAFGKPSWMFYSHTVVTIILQICSITHRFCLK